MGRRIAATATRTVKGARRASNQDRHLVDDELGVVLLADGVAGRPAGERAAELAINAAFTQLALALHRGPVDLPLATTALTDAFRFAHAAVEQAARRDESLRNMASTLVGCIFVDGHVVVASIGDSRAYRLRHAFLKQMTTDHVVHHDGLAELPIEDARAVRPLVQLLTRAVGNALSAEPDVHVEAVAERDVLLFCSNGLSDVLERHAMAEVLLGADSLEVACDRLVEAVAGADDDVTVVLVRPASRGNA